LILCIELYSSELALRGYEVLGLEGRQSNVTKAQAGARRLDK